MTEPNEPEDNLAARNDWPRVIGISDEIIEIALRRLADCRANPAAMLTETELWKRIDSNRKPRK